MNAPRVLPRQQARDRIRFDDLATASLVVDAVYCGGAANNLSSDPLNRLMRAGNAGGFRWRGSVEKPAFVVLFTTLDHPDWPDHLDTDTGRFVYYGDNRSPGVDLHYPDGNRILRNAFSSVHATPARRELVPPFFVFSKVAGRDVRFCGLAVPGAPSVRPTEDLVAVWRSTRGSRFQNYRATFTILNEAKIARAWVDALIAGENTSCAPPGWQAWVETGRISPLEAPRTLSVRTKAEQLPADERGTAVIGEILLHFENDS
jgi:hypothetical protein